MLRSFPQLISEKLEKAGTVDFKKHPARKVGTRSGQGRPKVPGRFAFPGARNPRICSISRSGKNFPAIFPGLSRSFPGEPPNRPRKQPQPSRVFWLILFFFVSEGEKPPKIRKKKFPGTKFLGTFGPPPTEKTEKIGKIKGTLVRKVPGNLRSQEFVFFFLCGFSAPYFWAFVLWVQKNPVNFLQNFPPKNNVSPTSFGRSARRRFSSVKFVKESQRFLGQNRLTSAKIG